MVRDARDEFVARLEAMAATSPLEEHRRLLDAQEERRREAQQAADRLSHLRSQLLLSLSDGQLEGREALAPEVVEAWGRLFPDRPVVGNRLATPAQMQRARELEERCEAVEFYVSRGMSEAQARRQVAAEYGDPDPAPVLEAPRVVGGAESQDKALRVAAKAGAEVLAALGLLPHPDPQGDVAALAGIDYAEALREAGFTAQAAEEGARQIAWEQKAGKYIGFKTSVALLSAFGGHQLSIRPHLSDAVVERVEAQESELRGRHRPASSTGHPIQESAATLDPATVTASRGAPVPVVILTPGWGSAGYYSPAVLEQAARDHVIPAGTQMYIDHPSQSQRQDRPERSVRDLCGVLTEDAQWNGRELVSRAQFFAPFDEQFRSMAGHIGLSILGSATDIKRGTAEGRSGPIVEGLARVDSVDVVTRAGRGGRIVAS